MPKVQIQIVTHNSQRHLESLFQGIAKQQPAPAEAGGVDFNVLVIDNASTDGTVEMLERNFDVIPAHAGIQKFNVVNPGSRVKRGMTIRLITNQDNKGFARAHNQGFAECQAPYVLVLNPDVEPQPGCLAEMVRMMESDDRIAAVTPKLYKTLPFGGKSGIIDSYGIKMLAWGQVANIGENSLENAKFEPTEKVWGVSGACALYRLAALEAVKDEHGIFDDRFWMYKEDVDLAWRLNRAGFQCALAPKAVALHQRSVQKGDRKTRADKFKQESIKNHLLMLRKNLSLRDWWRLPLIIMYECLKFIFITVFETRNLKAYYGPVSHHT